MKSQNLSSRLIYVTLTALVALAIDLTTKSLAVHTLSTNSVTHLGPLDLRLTYNLGSTSHPVHASLAYLIEIRLLVVVVLVAVFFVLKSRVTAAAIGLVLAALLGNFLNLALAPHVVPDFLMLGPVWTADLADFYGAAGIFLFACSFTMMVVRLLRSIESRRPSSIKQLA